jgi:hypothetical protein
MVLGIAGSSLTAELNRLAGTTGLDSQGAANAWAGTTGLATVGALNVEAGKTTPAEYLDLQGICNELAAPAALRTISS